MHRDIKSRTEVICSGGHICNRFHYPGSSRELKKNIRELSAEEAITALHNLYPRKFYYRADTEDEHVGFIAEDVPELVATKDRKKVSSMDIVAVVIKVVQEQQKIIRMLSQS